jgi:hypothetical protein
MNTPRSTYGAQSSPSVRKYAKWIRVGDFNGLRDSRSSGRKRTFAIVSPPIPVGSGCKAIRRVLIFDNHPESLSLLSRHFLNYGVDLAAGRVRPNGGLAAPRDRRQLGHVVVGFISIMTLVLAIFWPLLAR